MEVRGSICKCLIYLFSVYFLLHLFFVLCNFCLAYHAFFHLRECIFAFLHMSFDFTRTVLLYYVTPPSLTELIIHRERWHHSRWLSYYCFCSKMTSFTPKGGTILLTTSIFNSSFYSPSFMSYRDLLFYVNHIWSVSCDYYRINIFWVYCGSHFVRHFVFLKVNDREIYILI